MQEALKLFVETETAAEEREVQIIHSRSVSSRVKTGQCITGLKFKEVDNDGLFVYSFTKNESKFRAGDLLIINEGKHQGDAVMKYGALVWLEEIDHVRKLIKLEKDMEVDPPQASNCTLDKGYFDYNSERLKQAIDRAYESEDIVALLEGHVALLPQERLVAGETELYREQYPRLTLRQRQALASALSEQATLIQGPPGSGKTYLLALIIEKAMAQGRSILVTAPTHRAIDNLLVAVAKLEPAVPILKIRARGKPSKLHPNILQTTVNNHALAELRPPFLIGTTIYQAFKLHQSDMDVRFNMVVIDEASQMPVAHAMSALLSAESYVIAGDHRQLPPVFKNAVAHPEFVKRSIFEHMHETYSRATITLDVTFRMNTGINEFPSRAFYDNQLHSSPCAADRRFAPLPPSGDEEIERIIANQGAVTFVELAHRHAVQRAPQEADLVARIARTLLVSHRVSPQNLAIVSPHRGQNETIRDKLLSHLASESDLQSRVSESTAIDTVDRLQGQERDVIIFSLCASDRNYAIERAPFLYSPNRLNVAITRCRTRLFLVGSKYFFPHLNGIVIDSHHMRLWESYYAYLVSSGYRVVHHHRDE